MVQARALFAGGAEAAEQGEKGWKLSAEIIFKKYVYGFDNRNLKCYNLPIFLREKLRKWLRTSTPLSFLATITFL